ncbi:MAG: hypothetical protein J7639_23250 [Paenibacillaceae bacterium]|uniref:hypothetical protein n=1 Tax=Paenibacillus cymbidii TaxID=1639034 RepID=UPI001082279B|nr:hypothetical protein [Paenibacillus cymbidii]MBO9608891.1 hypothetical protein [Paenibacillaceae bacterium]
MTKAAIAYKNKTIPVHRYEGCSMTMEMLRGKMMDMQYDFDFRRKLKEVLFIEMIGGVAVFKYADGSKLYLAVS